jgi:hypothetical protein
VIKSRFLNQSSELSCAGLSTNFSYIFSGPSEHQISILGVRSSNVFRRVKDFNKVCNRPLVSSQRF